MDEAVRLLGWGVAAVRPLLLDLFSGAGGAAMGYHRAGFDVVGVDIAFQPHYPFEFHQADALTFPLDGFDVIHASPPCQAYSRMNHVHKREHPELIEPTRVLLRSAGLPHVIENVEGAPLENPITLCGTSFGLGVIRHRLFESSVRLTAPPCDTHRPGMYAPTGHGDPNWRKHRDHPHLRGKGYTQRCRDAMGIDWRMNRDEMAESIPPAYTEWIGKQLMEAVGGQRQ